MIYRFENKEYIIVLLLIPPLMGIWWLITWLTRSRLRKLGDASILNSIAPLLSSSYTLIKYVIVVITVLLIIIALINPQTGSESVSSKTAGLEVNVIVDVSNSMLANDLSPNRMEVARKVLFKLSRALAPNKIGITVFAGEAFNQLPPTSDYSVLDAIISTLSPETIPTQGSNLSYALETGMNNFSKKNDQKRVMIFLSDGESHEERFLGAAKEAVSRGITIHTIGVGTSKGSTIPIELPNGKVSFLRDPNGEIVKSALNPGSLISLAKEARGVYTTADDEAGIQIIIDRVNSIPKKIINEKIYSQFESYFPYFIAAALALILLEFFIPQSIQLRKHT